MIRTMIRNWQNVPDLFHYTKWATSWDYGTFHPPQSHFQVLMRSHPVGLDVWILVPPFIYFHTSCVRTAKALVRLCRCAGSPEPSLVAYVISTIISWAGSNGKIIETLSDSIKWAATCKKSPSDILSDEPFSAHSHLPRGAISASLAEFSAWCKQRFWQDWAAAQAPLNLFFSHMQ